MDFEIINKTNSMQEYKIFTKEIKKTGHVNSLTFEEKLKYLKRFGPLEIQVLYMYILIIQILLDHCCEH